MGRVCREGSCVNPACSKDVDCPNDEICEASVCKKVLVPVPVTPQGSANEKARQSSTPARQVEEESITGLWAAGIITTFVVYITTIALTASLSQESVRGQAITYVLVPVIGPFLLNGSAIANPQYSTPLVFSGLVQTAGVAMIVAGLVMHRPVAAPSYALGAGPNAARLSVTPTLLGASGMTVNLSF